MTYIDKFTLMESVAHVHVAIVVMFSTVSVLNPCLVTVTLFVSFHADLTAHVLLTGISIVTGVYHCHTVLFLPCPVLFVAVHLHRASIDRQGVLNEDVQQLVLDSVFTNQTATCRPCTTQCMSSRPQYT